MYEREENEVTDAQPELPSPVVKRALIDIELADGTRRRYEVDNAIGHIQVGTGFTRTIAFIFDEPSMVREPPRD